MLVLSAFICSCLQNIILQLLCTIFCSLQVEKIWPQQSTANISETSLQASECSVLRYFVSVIARGAGRLVPEHRNSFILQTSLGTAVSDYQHIADSEPNPDSEQYTDSEQNTDSEPYTDSEQYTDSKSYTAEKTKDNKHLKILILTQTRLYFSIFSYFFIYLISQVRFFFYRSPSICNFLSALCV